MTLLHNVQPTTFIPSPDRSAKLFAREKHPFHILRPSTLPLLTGFFLFCLLVPLVFYMHGLALPVFNNYRSDIMHLSFIGLFSTVMK